MRDCNECEFDDNKHYIKDSCNGWLMPGNDDIGACPFCGSPRMSPQTYHRTKCGHRCTEYACGTKLVVNYVQSRFIAVNETSNVCDELRCDVAENTI